MNLILRLILLLFGAQRRSSLDILAVSVLPMRVWPNDLDIFRHMNNGRYLTIMDLGRTDLMLRTGFVAAARDRGWLPVVGAVMIEYKRPLKLFQRFHLHTRLVGWDERWFYLEQEFHSNGKLAATATVKTMIRNRDGFVPTGEVVAAIGFTGAAPSLPPDADYLSQAEPHNADMAQSGLG